MSTPNLVEIATHGGWWCNAHIGWGEPTDDTIGEVWQRCAVCHAVGSLEWRPPVMTPNHVTTTAAEGQP